MAKRQPLRRILSARVDELYHEKVQAYVTRRGTSVTDLIIRLLDNELNGTDASSDNTNQVAEDLRTLNLRLDELVATLQHFIEEHAESRIALDNALSELLSRTEMPSGESEIQSLRDKLSGVHDNHVADRNDIKRALEDVAQNLSALRAEVRNSRQSDSPMNAQSLRDGIRRDLAVFVKMLLLNPDRLPKGPMSQADIDSILSKMFRQG